MSSDVLLHGRVVTVDVANDRRRDKFLLDIGLTAKHDFSARVVNVAFKAGSVRLADDHAVRAGGLGALCTVGVELLASAKRGSGHVTRLCH